MRRVRTYSGLKSSEVSEREIRHRMIARKAACEGFVLMKNEGVLPIGADCKIFLAGNGAIRPIKGGTGSGDVNEREVVDILTGLKIAGIEVVNANDIEEAKLDFQRARLEYRDEVLSKIDNSQVGSGMDIFGEIKASVQRESKKIDFSQGVISSADLCIYVISRIAGEGNDRKAEAGDYYLSEQEKSELDQLCSWNENVLVLINAGGQIDLNYVLQNKNVKGILNISQPGMELGNAVADVLTGKVTPSGKLTSTWTKEYMDFPNSRTFSHNNGDVKKEYYSEGIYVGYRYFDSFGVDVLYPFGFGLSYTDFSITGKAIEARIDKVTVSGTVTNVGDTYKGAEVMQVYVACPQKAVARELKKLAGFAKTKALEPGESQELVVEFDYKAIAYFDEKDAAWKISAGEYIVLVGNSSQNLDVCGKLEVENALVLEKVEHIHPLNEKLDEIVHDEKTIEKQISEWEKSASQFESVKVGECILQKAPKGRRDLDEQANELAARLNDDELVAILMGEITKGQDNLKENQLVETGIFVPGAAGETTCMLEEKYDIPAISMADGPAGIRVLRKYDVDRASGKIYSVGLMAALEGGLFAKEHINENVDTYYQYATAIPIGTHIAQSFDVDLAYELGTLVGHEMVEFGVAWWLAPGMNIHRNPLCGRNFEYFGEDPVISGEMAAAITLGVQSIPGIGTTIKHFACNNQEENRMGSDSIVSERTLREIYLRGFEIAVKKSQPMCIMTSYNLINGIHTANSYDLCTIVARQEWGFEGVIMTDWTTTTAGGSVPHVCALVGNDLIMPGNQKDVDDIKSALVSGALPRKVAREAAARMIKVLLQTTGMENAESYSKQFLD